MASNEYDGRLEPMRLQKFLARAGIASRRGSEEIMAQGRVRVNGEVASELGTKVDPAVDVVEVDGARVSLNPGSAYLVLNKPENVITTMEDPQGRPTVVPLVPVDRFPGLFPVGRLDRDTTGVLLFMTDGDLSSKLLHPSSLIEKTYHAVVKGRLYDEDLDPLREGVELDDGPTAPARCRLLSPDEAYDVTLGHLRHNESAVEITITEGRKREVKRMFGAIRHPVLELNRVSFGPITARGLAMGSWRMLTTDEVGALRKLAEKTKDR